MSFPLVEKNFPFVLTENILNTRQHITTCQGSVLQVQEPSSPVLYIVLFIDSYIKNKKQLNSE